MSKKELIEDSQEVREAMAELKAKAESEAAEETADTTSTEEDSYNDYAEDESSYAEDYTEESQTEESAPSEIEEEQTSAEKSDAGAIARTREETRRLRKAQFSENRQAASRDKEEGVREKRPARRRPKSKKTADSIISLENVSMEYVKGRPALKNVNIEIKKGEFVFIVGGSGSGKSTLIKLLLRELVPTTGSINVNGYTLEKLKHRKIPMFRRNIGVVFQDFRLLKDKNVYENVAFAQRIVQTPAREIKKNVPEMLSLVGLAKKYKATPNHLSGGEQQRVALARAIVNKPPILLADEPTGNLDPSMTVEIMDLLEKINQNGTTVIVVTHDDKIVNQMHKRVITIKKGIVLSDEEEGSYTDED